MWVESGELPEELFIRWPNSIELVSKSLTVESVYARGRACLPDIKRIRGKRVQRNLPALVCGGRLPSLAPISLDELVSNTTGARDIEADGPSSDLADGFNRLA